MLQHTRARLISLSRQDSSDPNHERLIIKELEVAVDYSDVRFDFKELMGGGAVGSAANLVINAVGGAIVDAQKKNIASLLKETFRKAVSQYI